MIDLHLHTTASDGRSTPAALVDELAAARAIMTPDEYRQEFECGFQAAVKGAIYATELEQARADGRVTTVPVDPALPVDTDWDLGMGDSTSIVFSQSLRSGEVRIVDYYEASGEGFPHYAQVLQARGYPYGRHWAPHDIAVRELGTGKSRLEVSGNYGIAFQMTPRLTGGASEVEDGIHAVWLFLPRCWFDQARTAAEYRDLIIAWRNGAPVRLSDVAEVIDSTEDIRNEGQANGKRSVLAFTILRNAGRQQVASIKGGLIRWMEEGLPVA